MTGRRMSAARTIALSSILVTGLGAATGAVQSKDVGILFSVTDYSRPDATSPDKQRPRIVIEPFAYVVDGKLVKIPADVDQQQFVERYYSKNHRYTLFSGGRSGGSVEVGQPAIGGECETLSASAVVTPAGKVAGRQMALASNVALHELDYIRRPASGVERVAIVSLATQIYTGNGISADWAAKAQVTNITAVEGKLGATLIASFSLVREVEGRSDRVDAAFLIAEKNSKGVYETTYAWFGSGAGESLQTQHLVDVMDITGTGVPDVVAVINYYESAEYHVYRKLQGKWQEIYNNSFGGC